MINSSDLTLTAIGTDIKRKSADTLVLGVMKNGDKVSIAASPFSADVTTELETSLTLIGVGGKADEVTLLPGVEETKAKVLLFIGLGVKELAELDAETLRRAAGSAARQMSNAKSAIFALPADTAERVAAIASSARRQNPKTSARSEKSYIPTR